jgi:TPR repeat protein
MQYYALGNLSSYLKNNKVSLEKRESITKGILEGIAFLHKHKVVHRDLKPSNILVVDRKGIIIPKITDFGLSKQAEAVGKASRFTNSFAGGTLQYSSPEQLKGLPLKLNTDLWSFGAIAYEILTETTLFVATSNSTASAEWQNEITQNILHADISLQIESLPKPWNRIVTACLKRDMQDRAQNTSDLMLLFDQKDRTTTTVPVTEKPEIKTENKTNSSNDDATVIKGQTIPTEKQKQPKPSDKTVPIQEKNDLKKMLPIAALVGVLLLSTLLYFMFSGGKEEIKEQPLVIFKEGTLYGYKKGDQTFIKPQFLTAAEFVNDSAQVAVADSSYIIDFNGKWLATVTDSILLRKNITENTRKDALALDKLAWLNAKKKNTKVAYEKYLKEFKNGRYRKTATSAITNLDRSSNTESISSKILSWKELKKWANNEENMKNVTLLANKGNTNAQIRMGLIILSTANYDHKDKGELARDWFLKAANKGSVIAQNELSKLHDDYTGYLKNGKECLKWTKKAANQNHPESLFRLGYIYNLGYYGVTKDVDKSIELWIKSANKGHVAAMQYLANEYRSAEDYKNALKWYKKLAISAKPGDYEYHVAEDDIAEMYYLGNGVAKNYKEALKWYKKVANINVKGAFHYKYGIGRIYYYGGYGVTKNYKEALKWFKSAACEGCNPNFIGVTESQFMFGKMYEKGEGVTKNIDEAIKYYKLVAKAGFAQHHKDAAKALKRLNQL